MAGFFGNGKVDTTRFDRNKLPCGPNDSDAVYRVRLTDAADHLGGNGGDRTQFNFSVISGPMAGKTGAELVMHGGYKFSWQADKARGTLAIVLGAFAGMTTDKAGFKVDNEFFAANTRNQTYNGNTVASKTRDASELPLVKAEAECFLIVKPYFDRKTGERKVSPKSKQKSVLYEFQPLSANLTISQVVESIGGGVSEDDAPEMPSDEPEMTPAVDTLALALQDGWRVNPNAPAFYFKKIDGKAEQLKEAHLRARYTK